MTAPEFWYIACPAFILGVLAGQIYGVLLVRREIRKMPLSASLAAHAPTVTAAES